MSIKFIITILISAAFVNNLVLTQMLGLCPFIGASRRVSESLCIGFSVTFVMTLSSLLTHLAYRYLLVPYNITGFRTFAFILIIAVLVQVTALTVSRMAPALYGSLGIYIPLITTNCAVLGITLLNINSGFAVSGFGLIKSVIHGFGGGAGFTLSLAVMSGIRGRLELADIPGNLKELPVLFITAGILALAFLGFAGNSL